MRRHNCVESGYDSAAEGMQFHVVKAVLVVIDHGQKMVAVLRRVAMPGEVLAGRDDPGFLKPADILTTVTRYHFRIVGKTAHVDYRIVGVVIHVQDRRKIHIDSQRPQFFADRFSHAIGHFLIGRGDRHCSGRESGAAHNPGHHSPFLVDGDQGHDPRRRGYPLMDFSIQREQLFRVVDVSREEDDVSEFVFRNQRDNLGGKFLAGKTEEKQLSDLFLYRHFFD